MLSRELIVEALEMLNERLGARGQRAELFLVGGAVMCLVHQARPSTKDVDGWFAPPQEVRRAAREVAEAMTLPEDWLNDAAKGFVPANAGYERWRAMSNLEVSVADAATLLAMKCAAARTDVDTDDIRQLAAALGVHTSADVLAIVGRYFPDDRLPVRTRLLLEEMFDGSS